jgi:hypothetical protein
MRRQSCGAGEVKMASVNEARSRPGWALDPGLGPVEELVRRRRWRVLRAALPQGRGLDRTPSWVTTPEEFIDWLIGELSPNAVRGYFQDIELIAKQTCDLELLRFARNCKLRC